MGFAALRDNVRLCVHCDSMPGQLPGDILNNMVCGPATWGRCLRPLAARKG